ncbi:hypothetical protein [Roseivirga echinicomitans]|uniref:Uncharacterized protein n=1 Tax=Roseivirga echinicomitans TaxID=296218 RepID=A0A150XD28_9BACT|nr:hypothetical protein [Roseivirga echinicomitans]KYG76637.1 hypothetical protein AWN68_06315 [Roseivirga echinicomitans]
MKGNPIDDLFREKLGSHKIAPPANAWSQIEGNLAKKKKGAFFSLSIAASIVIILTAGALYINQANKSGNDLEQLQANKEVENEGVKTPDQKSIGTPANEKENTENQPQEKEADPSIQVIQPQQITPPARLTAQVDATPTVDIIEPTEESRVIINFDKIDIGQVLSVNTSVDFDYLKLMPLTLRDYTDESFEIDMQRKKKFSMMDGLISIAKSVSKTKETLSDLRATKNEFVANELKYGVDTEGEDDTKFPDNKQEK